MNAIGQAHLADEAWSPCSLHAVVLTFLRAEWEKWPTLKVRDRRLIAEQADLTDVRQNNERMRALLSVRGPLLGGVPNDTQWFEVRHLRADHFGQLHAINFRNWNSPADMNELEKVALRKPLQILTPVASWQPPILWGHDQGGPFSILEGNHRLAALACAAAEHQHWRTLALVGLSPRPCGWHRPDGLW